MRNEDRLGAPDLDSVLAQNPKRPTARMLDYTLRLFSNLRPAELPRKTHWKVLQHKFSHSMGANKTGENRMRKSQKKVAKDEVFEIDKELKKYLKKR